MESIRNKGRENSFEKTFKKKVDERMKMRYTVYC